MHLADRKTPNTTLCSFKHHHKVLLFQQ